MILGSFYVLQAINILVDFSDEEIQTFVQVGCVFEV